MGPRAVHRFLVRVALAGAHVFAWIFVFQYFFVQSNSVGQGIASTALTYALAQVVGIFVTPYAGARLRNGFRFPLVFATLALALAFGILSASFGGVILPIGWGIAGFATMIGVYRGLYWIPYEMARARDPGTRFNEFWFALVPALAGLSLTLAPLAPVVLLAGAAALAILALIPLVYTQEIVEGYAWGYRETFHQLFARPRRDVVFEAFLSGIEAAALLLMWPLAMFMLFGWSYATLGIVLMLTYAVTYAAHVILKRQLRHARPGISAFAAASAWVMRLAVGGATGVVLVDAFFYTGSQARMRGVDMLSFEQVADNNTYVDEHTALKEMAMGIGRVVLCLEVALLAGSVSVPLLFMITFGIAAVAAAGSVVISYSATKRIA